MSYANLRSQSRCAKPVLLAFALSVSSFCGAQEIALNGGLALPPLPMKAARSEFCAAQLAQTINPLAKMGTKAYSVPISNREFYIIASLPGMEAATIRVQEGAMGKIISASKRAGFAVIPTINPVSSTAVDFKVFALTVDEKGNERISQKGSVTGTIGEEKALEAAQGLRLTLKRIEIPSSVTSTSVNDKREPKVLYASADKTDCCLTCGDTQACGDAVCLECGSCHDSGTPAMNCN